ncbi:MAG TPA: hypothetical protein VMR46_01965 [Candidatus Paceibacterota bacterium]|nr:hypothetical protein [Candidatus Paceibacterota bacterium]
MHILPLRPELVEYLKKRNLTAKFNKQMRFLEVSIYHPSLNVELMEPKALRIFSFRIDQKYRAIFIFNSRDTIEIVDINNHYH